VNVFVPLAVAVPLITAAAIAAVGPFLPRLLVNVASASAACFTAVASTLLVFDSAERPIEYLFAGWEPRDGVFLGITFSVEPLSAVTAALAATLATASLVFSLRYFAEAAVQYHVLMLVFLAGMTGFSLSGDLFNMFVFFELMSVCAFALTGYAIDKTGPLQGAINFAVTNSLGAFLILFGTALLYGKTGALNLHQIGEALERTPRDGLIVVAFTLLVAGFLVKAGAVPFHFWLSDAYAVAPATVGVLLAGVMSDLGLHGIVRVYWSVFGDTLGGVGGGVRGVLVAVGIATALVGAVMAFLQANLKRMLAFVTISQIGLALVGVALLTALGLAGSTVTIVSQGLLRGALFLAIGLVLHRLHADDELTLRGRATQLYFTATVMFAAALGLAGLPPFGSFLGVALIQEAAAEIGYGWVAPVLMVSSGVAAGALLRAGARIFLGLGDRDDPLLARQPLDEEAELPGDAGGPHRSPILLVPALALVVAALGLSFAPGIAGQAERASARVLHRPAPATTEHSLPASTWAYGGAGTALALAVAAFGLYRRRVPAAVRAAAAPAARALHAAHTGVVGDYVAWLVVGTALLGGVFALVLI
jgi:multicomponent Na+:H+ antiporter subunit D